MSWLDRLFARKRLHADLREEVESYIAERTEALIDHGIAPAEAARQARLHFGNPSLTVEHGVEAWQFRWLASLWADFRFALHQLRKSPGYAITAVLTLAIGIGANAAIFTVLDDAMLRSLPVHDPSQLVTLGFQSSSAQNRYTPVQFGAGLPVLDKLRSLSGISGWEGSMVTFPDDQNTLRSFGADVVTGNALSLLDVHPMLGRLLTQADDVPGGPEGGWPVVLDYGFWLANFHGDPGVIGRRVKVSGQPAVIVGILPHNFHGIYVGEPQRLFLPMHFLSAIAATPQQDPYQHPESMAFEAVARLASGSTLTSLKAELAALNPQTVKSMIPQRLLHSPFFRSAQPSAESASRGFSLIEEQFGKPLLLIQGIVFAVLLLCCVNLAGLQLARLQNRRHEFAVRSALGATRRRILQQCLVESMLLAVIGSALAAAIAWTSIRTIAGFFTPAGFGDPVQLQPDLRVLLFSGALAVLTALCFGLVPAILAGRIAPNSLLTVKGTGMRRNLLRHRLFIPAQFALALALVFTAGLFTHTLVALRDSPSGFNPSHITEVTAQFQALKQSPGQIMQLYRSITDELRVSPGIQSAAYTWVTPLTGMAPKITIHTFAHSGDKQSLAYNDVGDDYFSTIGTHLLSGRGFTPSDRDRSVCVINQSAARLLFPNAHSLGDSLAASAPQDQVKPFTATCRIVGIVENARYSSLRVPAPPTIYFPACTSTVAAGGYSNNLVFFIRSPSERDAISAYRAALHRFAPTTAYMTFLPLSEQVDESIGSERLIAGLSATFAGVALLLSGIGLFGILALRVQQRMPEIGVRLALGATRGHILGLILRDALSMVGLGTVAGIVLIALTATFTRRFLYDTSPIQPGVILLSLFALLAVALIATLIPARRAAGLDPALVLRNE
jgi:predicted permease